MDQDTIESLLAVDEARYQALYAQDVTALAGMLRDDYLHTHANGKTDGKDAFLASIRAAKYRFVRAERSDHRLRLAGAVALLSGHTVTTLDVGGELRTICNAFVTAWVREDAGWRLLHWQATKLPEA